MLQEFVDIRSVVGFLSAYLVNYIRGFANHVQHIGQILFLLLDNGALS